MVNQFLEKQRVIRPYNIITEKWKKIRTHQCFGSEPGTGSDIPAKVPDPQHRRRRRDLPLRGFVAFAIAGPTVHGRATVLRDEPPRTEPRVLALRYDTVQGRKTLEPETLMIKGRSHLRTSPHPWGVCTDTPDSNRGFSHPRVLSKL